MEAAFGTALGQVESVMIYRATNMDDVSKILNHRQVLKFISDDSSLIPYIPNEKDFYIMNDKKTGVIKIDQINGISCSIHIAALPELWGKTKEFVKEAIDWGFRNTVFVKIIAIIPEYNKLAIRLCINSGFEKEGLIKKSFLKNWKFYNQIIFGLTKTQFYKGE